MKAFVLTILLMLTACVAAAQMKQRITGAEAERQWQEEQELGDLYKRAVASRFVVIGTVAKDTPVGQRGKQPAVDDVAGILHSVHIDEVVCRQQDFDRHSSKASPQTPQEIDLFVPLKPLVEGPHLRKETLLAGRRYLLFLVQPDRAQQKIWTDSFFLDPQLPYYRAEELSRGVVPLFVPTAENPSPQQPAVLATVKQLCQAVRPPNLDDKLARLHELAASHDPILQREARIAISALQLPN